MTEGEGKKTQTVMEGVIAAGQREQGQTFVRFCALSHDHHSPLHFARSPSLIVFVCLFLLSFMAPHPFSLRVCKKEEKELIFSQHSKAKLLSDLGIKEQTNEWIKLLSRGKYYVDEPQGKSSRGIVFLLLVRGGEWEEEEDQEKCRLVISICPSKAWARTV